MHPHREAERRYSQHEWKRKNFLLFVRGDKFHILAEIRIHVLCEREFSVEMKNIFMIFSRMGIINLL